MTTVYMKNAVTLSTQKGEITDLLVHLKIVFYCDVHNIFSALKMRLLYLRDLKYFITKELNKKMSYNHLLKQPPPLASLLMRILLS